MTLLKKVALFVLAPLLVLYALLLIPDSDTSVPRKGTGTPFLWNRDTTWQYLEAAYRQAKKLDQPSLDSALRGLWLRAEEQLYELQQTDVPPDDSRWNSLENNFFAIAPLAAVQTGTIDRFVDFYSRVRNTIKQQSQRWDMSRPETRRTLYTTLYGMRSAVEEVLLVSDTKNFFPVLSVKNEPSSTPSATILDIPVHSGDLLVSRGGAEVSALISRGNDFPGNFSHVALLYVDADTHTPFFVESHIEKGVAIATTRQYIEDKKLRFMVLRPRADLPQLVRDPQLPHKAAEYMYRTALKKHIPYDFKMEFHDPAAMFCSEVGSYAYLRNGLQLWQAVSTISSPGVVHWLHAFGVENFVTQMPSDLEYDPQLSVVAEWRNPETLLKDHIDNAVMDVLLQRADRGEDIEYSLWQLPFVRVVKAYCLLLNLFDKPGIIPEGMSATQALRNNTFVDKHVSLKNRTEQAVRGFIKKNGYTPPYWQIVKRAENV
jgi:hypothetical protein